ncbi:MAG TPA: 5'-3' exonuclease H3TH domain-containing protein [Candidatus Levybacteria bacterium]|nr:5'-3' exonuclease H3TH domain-containing protein [Candidatus Levybacteria bacterium]
MEKDLKKNIFLVIDGSAIVHRAYHAMPSLTTPDGIPTGAVHGFFSMLLKLIQELRPSHVAVAFDRPKPNFRKELYKEYQSQRPSMDSDLSPQFQIIQDILTIAHIPVYFMDGFEADDIIGTLAHKAEEAGDISYIVTGDRDMMQLVDKRTKVLVPIKGISEMKLFDEERVIEQFGVLPTQIVELKALQGDASDNYPGVAGVGPKTAAGLIQSYKNVHNIYKNLDEIRAKNPKLADKLEAGHDHAILAHQLATILKNVPFEYNYKDCRVEHISHKDWRKAFESYSFKTLPKRLDEAFGKEHEKSKEKNEKNNNTQMKLL